MLFVCSCDIPGVPHDDLEFKSTQNGGRRARVLQVFPLLVEEVEQKRQSFSGILILFTVNFSVSWNAMKKRRESFCG